VLALYAHNVEQIRLPVTYRAFAVVACGTLLLLVTLRALLKDWHRAALTTLITLVLFFSYGQVYLLVKHFSIGDVLLGRHRFLAPLYSLLGLIALRIGIRKIRNPDKLTTPLNTIAIVMLLFPLITVLQFEYNLYRIQYQSQQTEDQDCPGLSAQQDPLPDVYYIILDAYAGHDTLWETYGYNNTEFLESLTNLGFYVADQSQSNYNHTELSMSSALNMEYLPTLDPIFGEGGPADFSPLWPLLVVGEVRSNFECLGYEIVTFDSGYHWTGWINSDYLISPRTYRLSGIQGSEGINAFESLLIQTSAGVIVTSTAKILPDEIKAGFDSPYQEHRDRILTTLNALESYIPFLQKPTFSFVHMLIPHPPYVFGPNGEPIEQYEAFSLGNLQGESGSVPERIGYPNQVTFINNAILQAVQQILENSTTPPIIIIQGDHGIGRPGTDKISILNAYYLPGDAQDVLYPTITPVNSFRIVFDTYFGGTYGLLEDTSYYSEASDLYDFTVIPNERISLEAYPFDPP
jgi:hypothetical protein